MPSHRRRAKADPQEELLTEIRDPVQEGVKAILTRREGEERAPRSGGQPTENRKARFQLLRSSKETTGEADSR